MKMRFIRDIMTYYVLVELFIRKLELKKTKNYNNLTVSKKKFNLFEKKKKLN